MLVGGGLHTVLQEQKWGLQVGRQQLVRCWAILIRQGDRTMSHERVLEGSMLAGHSHCGHCLGDPPSLALTMLSCSVNLPSVPSGQRDVITTCSWRQEEVSSEVPLLPAL